MDVFVMTSLCFAARYWLLIESALMTFLLVVMETDKTLANASLDDVTSRDAWKALCARQGIGLDLDLTLDAKSRSPQTAKSQRRALTRISRNLREGRHEAKKIKHMLVSCENLLCCFNLFLFLLQSE